MAGRRSAHSKEGLKKAIDAYFKMNKKDPNQNTPAGLLLHLKINKNMWNLYRGHPKLARICEDAMLKLEHFATVRLHEKGRSSEIFALKNFGWSDKTEVETKETLLIGSAIDNGQARKILLRYGRRKELRTGFAGTPGGDSLGSQAGQE